MKSILVFVGHTGAGKSTLAQFFSNYYRIKLLNFSNEGILLAEYIDDVIKTKEIEDDIYSCIYQNAANNEIIFVDGISSINVIIKLLASGFRIVVINVLAPYVIRIARVSKMYNQSWVKSVILIHNKERNKRKSGLKNVMNMKNILLYNVGDYTKVIRKTIRTLEKEVFRVNE